MCLLTPHSSLLTQKMLPNDICFDFLIASISRLAQAEVAKKSSTDPVWAYLLSMARSEEMCPISVWYIKTLNSPLCFWKR